MQTTADTYVDGCREVRLHIDTATKAHKHGHTEAKILEGCLYRVAYLVLLYHLLTSANPTDSLSWLPESSSARADLQKPGRQRDQVTAFCQAVIGIDMAIMDDYSRQCREHVIVTIECIAGSRTGLAC